MHAMVECLEIVLVGLYIPPPASTKLLHRLSFLIAKYATDNVILMGDFNMPPNPEMDLFTSVGGSTSDLSAWVETYRLTVLWRWRHPLNASFTCRSATYRTLLHIDLMCTGGSFLPRVQQISILPRGISDHAPLLLQLSLEGSPLDKLWRLSRFWISDPRVDSGFHQQMNTYWAVTPVSALGRWCGVPLRPSPGVTTRHSLGESTGS